MDRFVPTPEDRFSFGLWTVGHTGRDSFGDAVRPQRSPEDLVRGLAACGVWGVNLHDEDLVPFGASKSQRDDLVGAFQTVLTETGMVVPMATTNLFRHPVFKDGAFTADDPEVRALAIRKSMDAIDLGAELGASIYVFWGGREGCESDVLRDPRTAIKRLRAAINFLSNYVLEQEYPMVFALEAKPNEPRGDIYLPTTGSMLHFITTLEHPEMVGVNPEVAHETMSGLSFHHAVAQAMEVGKLFHIDLNAQRIGRYDQDYRFGSEDLKGAFHLVRLLEGTEGGFRYEGPRHFDAHAYRTEDDNGVWEFVRGCMRTYKILAERAVAFDAEPEVRAARQRFADDPVSRILMDYAPSDVAELRAMAIDVDA
ncbi:MAG: xylose isomerase, partial [Planctomycetes bacterium]|nr:xylose isomerase [Planctomycetota bacterium]